MNRLGRGAFAAFAAHLALILWVASAGPAAAQGQPDYGGPPSGEIPILFNDRHVYSKPDRLKAGRVLSAIVRNGTILVPLRSMFEQMGGAVSFDPATKSVDVSKPGADVKVTVGKPEVTINGETRPLDVPPEIYQGTLLVPLRVISEGMGAYVQWLPDKREVVVRYLIIPPVPPQIPATIATAPPATPSPAPSPAPTPKPPPKPTSERFIVGDYIFSPKVYNELSPGNVGTDSFSARAAFELPLFDVPWMLEGDFTSFRYPHNANLTGACAIDDGSCAAGIGQQGLVYVPRFQARNDDFEGKFGLKVSRPRIYVGLGYLFRNTNYEGGAFASQAHGVGGGLEKLPDLDQPFSLYGSVFYYPNVGTNQNQDLGNGSVGQVQYQILKYRVGATFNFGRGPVFLDLGYLGDRENNKLNASSDSSSQGPFAGLGIHF